MKKIYLIVLVIFSLQIKASGFINPSDTTHIIIPNIFTPNGDNVNDTWSMVVDKITAINMFDLQTTVYNSWGKQVFETTNTHQNWNGNNLHNGNPCDAGTFYYIISYTEGNTGQVKTLRGFLEIIR